MRAVGASPRLTMGLTVSLLLLLVPLVALVIMAAVGNRDGVAYALVGLVAACGVYATYDGWRQSAQAAGLAEFARVNGLRYVRSSMASQYAGSLFAQERVAVSEAVRTSDRHFIEIGDMWEVTAPGPRRVRQPLVYLRIRLRGPIDLRTGLPSVLDARLQEFAGDHVVEFARGELTVFGSRPLQANRTGRVREAFALAEEIAALASTQDVPFAVALATPHKAEFDPGTSTRRFGPLKVVLITLALLIFGPLVIALILSSLEDELRGNRGAAQLVVGVVVAGALLFIGWLVRFMTRRNTPGS